MLPIVQQACPICGSGIRSGCAEPGQRFKDIGLRVFYRCGCQVSVANVKKLFPEPDDSEKIITMKIRSCKKWPSAE